MKVVPNNLTKYHDTLVLHSGNEEIDRIKVKNRKLSSQDRHYLQKKVRRSREKMFSLAKRSLADNKYLKRVVIVKSPPVWNTWRERVRWQAV